MPLSLPPRVVWLTGPLCVLLLSPLAGCGSGDRLVSVESPLPPADSTTPPPADPPDSVIPPPDSNPSPPQTPPPSHEGIPYGPAQQPPETLGPEFTGTIYCAIPDSVLIALEAARRAGVRVFLSLVGSDDNAHDENGYFSLDKWKQRIDRFRGMDLTSYMNDGTIIAHRLLDEPADPTNWNGKIVTLDQIEAMAQYSKEIWPTLPAVIRAWPAYVKDYSWHYLDAVWAQYTARFGPIDAFIANNVRDAQAAHLGLIGGLNLLNGGSSTSGIPGRGKGKYGMSASEITSWGSTFLSEPYICAFMMWEYDANYLSHSDIKQALVQLTDKARSHPSKDCRP
jgi:hypothetical protein